VAEAQTQRGHGTLPIAAAAILAAFAVIWAVTRNDFPDFFIYRAGSDLGLRGESPYDPEQIRVRVAAQFPHLEMLIENCGFFLPPQAIVLFAPFAILPYPAAKIAWALTNGSAAFACLLLPRIFNRPREEIERLRLPILIMVFVVLLAPTLTIPIIIVGQTTLLFIGSVAAGQWCFDRGRPLAGALLWSVPFLKPHLALALIPLAWYLGGWRRAALIVAVVAGLNLAGCLVTRGSPAFFWEYVEFLGSGHKSVEFNRAELNPHATSWNRLLFSFGGPLVELTAVTTIAGYLVWGGIILARCAATRTRPSPSWAMAAGAVGSLAVCQVLGYETLLLALTVPWLLDLMAERYRLRAAVAVALMLVQFVPYPQYLAFIESHGADPRTETILLSFRSISVALLAVVVLLGPATRRPSA
jgi:hypothetical protein